MLNNYGIEYLVLQKIIKNNFAKEYIINGVVNDRETPDVATKKDTSKKLDTTGNSWKD